MGMGTEEDTGESLGWRRRLAGEGDGGGGCRRASAMKEAVVALTVPLECGGGYAIFPPFPAWKPCGGT